VQRLDAALADCALLLAVIGRKWATAEDSRGQRRLDDPQDYVRVEIATALQRNLRVVPVLVDGTPMPSPADLPDQLAALSRRQAVSLADGSWGDDVARLCRAIEEDVQPEMAAAARAARRRRRMLALASGLALAVAATGSWLLLRAPDVSGAWRLADGSRWVVQQSGRDLQIEEVHVDTKEVWRKGTGRLRGDLLEVKLQYVFQPAVHLQGELRLAPGHRNISGILVETPGGRRVDFELRR
jgi:hypothetical protein